MKGLITFRCQSEGEMYKVQCISCPTAPYGYYYYVWKGRRRLKKEPFALYADATRYCTECCIGDYLTNGEEE